MGIALFDLFRGGLWVEKAASHPAGSAAYAARKFVFGRFASVLCLMWQVRRERNQLARLSRNELAEMGIHPGDARREAERGLFDLPKSRLDKI